MNDKSNKISIVVAIFAVILILGGVYLLNESFNDDQPASLRDSKENTMTYSVVEDDVSSDPSEAEELFSTSSVDQEEPDEDTTTNDTTTQSVIDTDKKEQLDKDEEDLKKAEEEKEALDKQKEEEEKKKAAEAELEDNQMLVTIDSTDGYNSTVTIVDCGVPGAVACAAGEELQLRALQEYTSIEEGKQYKLTGDIQEVDGYIYINTLDGVDLVETN